MKVLAFCSAHFITGKPAALYDQANPDWVPTLIMGYVQCKASSSDVDRYERAKQRREAAEAMLVLHGKRPHPETDNEHNLSNKDGEVSTLLLLPPIEIPGVACLTDESGDVIKQLQEANQSQKSEIIKLKSQMNVLSPQQLENNPDILKIYTGLPNWTIFHSTVKPYTTCHSFNAQQ